MPQITGETEGKQSQISSQFEMRVYERKTFNEMVSERSGGEI